MRQLQDARTGVGSEHSLHDELPRGSDLLVYLAGCALVGDPAQDDKA
jgi:hypothetical protein